MAVDAPARWRVLEVHNFGGFFGGDTVTLTAARVGDGVEETITIDEKALANMRDRYKVAPDMVFDLHMAGDRVDRAELLGAINWDILYDAAELAPSDGPLLAPTIRAYHCATCGLWILDEPLAATTKQCRLCHEPL